MLIIGITGSLGTGKTTVAKIFKRLGAVVLDADEIAHRLIAPNTPAWRRIKGYFGDGILRKDGKINRKALAKEVFSERGRLNKLCGIIHPLVYKEIGKKVKEIKKINAEAVVVLDIPLLLESGGRSKVDKLVVVTAGSDVQIKRAVRKFGLTRKEVLQRIEAQMPLGEKEKAADFVIDNKGSLCATERQAVEIWKNLVRE
ncbi:MAG: dephospho-CoA kinase [Candidatus Omnitrophota bacterium]|nr:dephospho-CoA kinase [Candidatus Omnitrophota bacterium]